MPVVVIIILVVSNVIYIYVLVIPQNEYGILVITRDRGARSSANNKDTIRVNGV